MIDEDNGEPIFTCYSHNATDLKTTISAFNEAIPAARKSKLMSSTQIRYKTSDS